jgi:hypothetical protein
MPATSFSFLGTFSSRLRNNLLRRLVSANTRFHSCHSQLYSFLFAFQALKAAVCDGIMGYQRRVTFSNHFYFVFDAFCDDLKVSPRPFAFVENELPHLVKATIDLTELPIDFVEADIDLGQASVDTIEVPFQIVVLHGVTKSSGRAS